MLLEKGGHSGEEALEDGRLEEVIVEVVEDPAGGEGHRGEEAVQVGKVGRLGYGRVEGEQTEHLGAKGTGRHHHCLLRSAAAACKRKLKKGRIEMRSCWRWWWPSKRMLLVLVNNVVVKVVVNVLGGGGSLLVVWMVRLSDRFVVRGPKVGGRGPIHR